MAERGLIEHNQSTKKEMWEKKPTFVAQQQAANQKAEANMLARWEQRAGDLREKRTGNREVDERLNFGGGWQGEARIHPQRQSLRPWAWNSQLMSFCQV